MSGPQLFLGNPNPEALSSEQKQATQPESDPMAEMGTDMMMDTILPGLGTALSVGREVHGDAQRVDPLLDLMTGKPVSHTAKPETTPKPVEPESPSEKPKPKGPTLDPM